MSDIFDPFARPRACGGDQHAIGIMFVCHGNICRSTMAEFVMKDLVERAGLGARFRIESSATSTEEIGEPVHHGTRRKLAEHGISCEGKRGEVDFVIESGNGKAVPIEVKSGRYYRAHAALDNVVANEGYGVERALVLSRGNIELDGKVAYLPLYALPFLPCCLNVPDARGFTMDVVRV